MDPYVTTSDASHTFRPITRMDYQGEDWTAVHQESQQALEAILDGQMEAFRKGRRPLTPAPAPRAASR